MRRLMARLKHTSVSKIVFNRVTKFSTCCLSLIVHLNRDAYDLFINILNATSRLSSHDLRSSGDFLSFFHFFFLFLSRSRGRESQVLASCAGWPISRCGKPSFISLTNSGPLFPSSSPRSLLVSGKKRQRAEKMTDLIFSEYVHSRRTLVYLAKKNIMNTVEIVK